MIGFSCVPLPWGERVPEHVVSDLMLKVSPALKTAALASLIELNGFDLLPSPSLLAELQSRYKSLAEENCKRHATSAMKLLCRKAREAIILIKGRLWYLIGELASGHARGHCDHLYTLAPLLADPI